MTYKVDYNTRNIDGIHFCPVEFSMKYIKMYKLSGAALASAVPYSLDAA